MGAFALAFLGGGNAHAAKSGHLDHRFGDDGWVRTRIVAHDFANEAAIDSKHRIVAAGSAADNGLFGLARYRPSGRLDHSFSGDGTVATGFDGTGSNYASSVAIDSRGRIVAGGSKCTTTACDVALARYKPDGSLDPSFDDDGKVTTNFGGPAYAGSVAIDAKDRIVIAGPNFVARYRQDGTLDPSFGAGGRANPPTGSIVTALTSVTVDSQGRIVAVGYIEPSFDHFQTLVTRFLANGDPDSSFGNGGRVIRHREGLSFAAAIDSNDRIMAAGGSLAYSGRPGDFQLAFYNEDGSPVRRFGGHGAVTTSFRDRHSPRVLSVAFDSRGGIVAIGSMGHDYALARYRPNGKLDRSFSGNGKASGAFGFPHRQHRGFVSGGLIDQRDRLVVAGGESHFLLARFTGYTR
jgi:uncharacterized delta-60 repeat protein